MTTFLKVRLALIFFSKTVLRHMLIDMHDSVPHVAPVGEKIERRPLYLHMRYWIYLYPLVLYLAE